MSCGDGHSGRVSSSKAEVRAPARLFLSALPPDPRPHGLPAPVSFPPALPGSPAALPAWCLNSGCVGSSNAEVRTQRRTVPFPSRTRHSQATLH